MRWLPATVCALGLLVGLAPHTAGAPPARLALSEIAHTLDGNIFVITGLIENLGPAAAGLVVDAVGYSVQGDELITGSDGIPWVVPSGGVERFSIRLIVRNRLIRDYVVKVAYARPPYTAIASVRRSVDLALYRGLILSVVQVRATLVDGWLFVRNRADSLPVAQVTVEVTVLLPFRKVFTLQTITLTVPADGTATAFIGLPGAVLVSTRITEVLLKVSWSD